jgi:two-component system chemotaxis response regulator CheY
MGVSAGQAPPRSLSELKVLIVDDSALVVSLLRRVLTGMNIREVLGVADGEAGLAALARIRPDLVFADRAMMPFDGLEFVRRVRRLPDDALSRTPVVMITNPAEEHRVQLARDTGVNAVLVEPISPPAVMSRVLQVLSDARGLGGSPASAGPARRRAEMAAPARPHRNKARRRVAG